MKRFSRMVLSTLLIVILACSTVKVSQDYDPATDFSVLKTYAWKSEKQEPTGDVRTDNPLLDARIRAAVDRALSEKGYQKISEQTPDFHVSYQYSVRSRLGADDGAVGFGFGFGTFGRHGGVGLGTGTGVSQYDEARLTIDFIDTQNGGLLWRGAGARGFYEHLDPDKTTKEVNETVDQILARFPPLPR